MKTPSSDINPHHVLGLDLGAGALKLWYGTSGFQILSQVAYDNTARIQQGVFGFSRRGGPVRVVVNGTAYLVGERAHDIGTPFERFDPERFTGDDALRALVYAGFTQFIQTYGPPNAPMHLVAGLSQDIARGTEGEAKAAVDAAKKWLMGTHTWSDGKHEHSFEVGKVTMTSQARAAYIDFMVDSEGALIPARKFAKTGTVGIISIGFNTVELLVIDGGAPVENKARSEMLGVRELLASLPEADGRTLGRLDGMLRAGRLELGEPRRLWAKQILSFIRDTWRNEINQYQAVICVGGGALLMKDELKELLGSRMHDCGGSVECTQWIARGLYKLGLLAK